MVIEMIVYPMMMKMSVVNMLPRAHAHEIEHKMNLMMGIKGIEAKY